MSTQRSIAFGPALLISMALFAGGTIFGIVAYVRWGPPSVGVEDSHPSSEISRGEWNALRASVAGIESRLRGEALESQTQRAPVDAASIDPASLEAVARSADELQATLDRMQALADSAERTLADAASTHEIAKATPEVNGDAVDAILALHVKDSATAIRDVRFATPNEILKRFGSPTTTSINEKCVQWSYYRAHRGLHLEFAQGAVIHMFTSG
jgi:hypothetical protein